MAAVRGRRQRNLDRLRGPTARLPPYPAARWAVRLREQVMSGKDIADRAGLSVTPVSRLLRTPPQGQTARGIAHTTVDAVLGILLPTRRVPAHPA
ncbi:hypothetical protein SAMN05428944_7827 [Streptomyces sp. 1222.5]|uniref:hypothetical protein n=1 Tax=unclassified Streptomyces TaxID=2593676 RepID=UPI000898F6BE|nr:MULTISPECIES: hypothetical protein [unclassified Streptomyces]PKW05177.1 hypothetical protein BX260_0256 [Streptomyces sp. 5112.2]SED48189.1 hypothetical protein SAMN05428944_7827 [Streptomyces sp. 1222.5]